MINCNFSPRLKTSTHNPVIIKQAINGIMNVLKPVSLTPVIKSGSIVLPFDFIHISPLVCSYEGHQPFEPEFAMNFSEQAPNNSLILRIKRRREMVEIICNKSICHRKRNLVI